MKKALHSYTYQSRKFITVDVICLCVFEFPMNFFLNLNNTRVQFTHINLTEPYVPVFIY